MFPSSACVRLRVLTPLVSVQAAAWARFSADADALVGGAPQHVQPVGDVYAWFRKLCAAPSGMLYEDASSQIPHRRGSVRV